MHLISRILVKRLIRLGLGLQRSEIPISIMDEGGCIGKAVRGQDTRI